MWEEPIVSLNSVQLVCKVCVMFARFHVRYALMLRCWSESMQERPTMEQVAKELDSLLQDSTNVVSIYKLVNSEI